MKTFLYHKDYPAGVIFEDEKELAAAKKEGWKDSPPHMWEEKKEPNVKPANKAPRGRPKKKV